MTSVSNRTITNIADLLNIFIQEKDKLSDKENLEFEIKFGTKKIKKIKKEHFDNVIKYLLSNGFSMLEESEYYLNVSYETVRVKINGIANVQDYCKNGIINTDKDSSGIEFMEKKQFGLPDGNPAIVNIDDFNFKASIANETQLEKNSPVIEKLLKDWNRYKKYNRLINRYTLTKEGYPVKIDLSIVKETPDIGKTFRDINLNNLVEKYEIEVELDNSKLEKFSVKDLDLLLKKVNKIILSGLQNTNYPISYPDIEKIKNKYSNLVYEKKSDQEIKDKEILPKDFIGPSSLTLQINNIIIANPNINYVNIRKDYTVTDKADGERKLLFIDNDGKIYLITTIMNIEFTGAKTKNDKLFNSLLDGEHILHNISGQFINLYAAFDIYFINKKDVRNLEFISGEISSEDLPKQSRWMLLDNFMKTLSVESIIVKKLSPIRIQMKKFYGDSSQQTIFDACNIIMNDMSNGMYEYETDGLIFTPKYFGVGQTLTDKRIKNYKHSWEYSLKWKPAKFNTIDFLITTKKTASGTDFIGNRFEEGLQVNQMLQISQYKTIILRVGYDKKKHGLLNPCQDIINDEIQVKTDIDNEERYKPVQFYPSNPFDAQAGVCNIDLKLDKFGEYKMFTENGEIIEDNTIVEFSYNPLKEKSWRWSPLRVRYDKTAEYRNGFPQYGNAYHVADSNWHSIHNPVTEEMISKGENIPTKLDNDDIYYNNIGTKQDTATKSLRDFHNLFVKYNLINIVSKEGDTLIDYAVGKGGDIPKWINAKLSFVFGIDSSKDNIRNPLDGVCARYLNYKQRFEQIPDGLFIFGDSSENIKDTSASKNEVGKSIIKAIFGEGVKDSRVIGKGVAKSYGKARDGFNISSIQFALHYMFQSSYTLHNFLTNLNECTQLNGYFIGTCFDGKKVFDLLKDLNINESYTFYSRDRKNKLLEITKRYDDKDFDDNISSLGYGIDILQSSINKQFREYLVNFEFLLSILEVYGFTQLNSDELKIVGLVESYGSFQYLHNIMTQEFKTGKINQTNYGQAYRMTKEEKDISFINNYFIFKKVRNITAKDVKPVLESKISQEKLEKGDTSVIKEEIIEQVIVPKTSLKEKREEELEKRVEKREEEEELEKRVEEEKEFEKEQEKRVEQPSTSGEKQVIKSKTKKSTKVSEEKDLLSKPAIKPPPLKLKKSTKTT